MDFDFDEIEFEDDFGDLIDNPLEHECFLHPFTMARIIFGSGLSLGNEIPKEENICKDKEIIDYLKRCYEKEC